MGNLVSLDDLTREQMSHLIGQSLRSDPQFKLNNGDFYMVREIVTDALMDHQVSHVEKTLDTDEQTG